MLLPHHTHCHGHRILATSPVFPSLGPFFLWQYLGYLDRYQIGENKAYHPFLVVTPHHQLSLIFLLFITRHLYLALINIALVSILLLT